MRMHVNELSNIQDQDLTFALLYLYTLLKSICIEQMGLKMQDTET